MSKNTRSELIKNPNSVLGISKDTEIVVKCNTIDTFYVTFPDSSTVSDSSLASIQAAGAADAQLAWALDLSGLGPVFLLNPSKATDLKFLGMFY